MSKVFKVGDRVKVVRAADGHGFMWIEMMNELIGQEFTVTIVTPTAHGNEIRLDDPNRAIFAPESLELVELKYIDGVQVTMDEFTRRTAPPVEMTIEEVQMKLGLFVKIK